MTTRQNFIIGSQLHGSASYVTSVHFDDDNTPRLDIFPNERVAKSEISDMGDLGQDWFVRKVRFMQIDGKWQWVDEHGVNWSAVAKDNGGNH